jgi:hypothetical protein
MFEGIRQRRHHRLQIGCGQHMHLARRSLGTAAGQRAQQNNHTRYGKRKINPCSPQLRPRTIPPHTIA